MEGKPAVFVCKECGLDVGDVELMRLHMMHLHGASVNWPGTPLLQLSDEEAAELYNYLLDAYLDVNKWPHLRQLLRRIDEHLGCEVLVSAE